MSEYLIITHNKTALVKFMLPYVGDKPYEVLLLEDGICNIFIKLLKLLFSGRKLIVLTQHPLTMIFFVFLIFRNKFTWVHFVTGQVWAGKKGLKYSLLEIADRFLLFFPKFKICDSRGQYDFLVQRWHQFPEVHFTGVGSMGGIAPIEKLREPTLTNLTISWIGRDTEDKDLPTLLEALRKVSHLNCKLLVYGLDGKNTENTEYCGFVNDIKYELIKRNVCINVVTSKREGFCLSILEAASVGIPTISTDIYGTKEIIDFIGMNEFSFPVGNSNALNLSILRFINMKDEDKRLLFQKANNVNFFYCRTNILKKFIELIEK